MRGERTTQSVLPLPLPRIAARFRTRTCSFLSVFLLPSLSPPFLYSLLHILFFSFANGGEWFQSGGFRGRHVAATELEGGWRRFCRPSATRCIVSLLHSFLILRPTCVANLRKPWPPARIFSSLSFAQINSSLFFRKFRPLRYAVLSSFREYVCSSVRISRDDYVIRCHARLFFAAL